MISPVAALRWNRNLSDLSLLIRTWLPWQRHRVARVCLAAQAGAEAAGAECIMVTPGHF